VGEGELYFQRGQLRTILTFFTDTAMIALFGLKSRVNGHIKLNEIEETLDVLLALLLRVWRTPFLGFFSV
jgi:hypothetical protein